MLVQTANGLDDVEVDETKNRTCNSKVKNAQGRSLKMKSAINDLYRKDQFSFQMQE